MPTGNDPANYHQGYFQAKWENFWVVLMRPKSKQLPDGVIDPDNVVDK